MANRVRLTGVAIGAACLMSASFAGAQGSGAPTLWTGHVSCLIDVQSDGYEHHEIQTWTLTGGSPASQGIPAYPATWSVAGHGTAHQVLGAPPGAVSWKSNVPPTSTALAIFVRPSDNRLVVLPRTRLSVAGGHSGTRQLAGGATQNVQYPAYEWTIPAITDSPTSAHLAGSGTSVVTGGMLPGHAVSGSAAANCSWEFSRSDAGAARAEATAGGATTPPPTPGSSDAALLQVSPNSVIRGQQKISVTITGRSTHFDQKTTKVMVGAGLFVSVDAVTVKSPTSLVANLNLAKTSGMRPRRGTSSFLVMVITGGEAVQLFDAFHVAPPHVRPGDSK